MARAAISKSARCTRAAVALALGLLGTTSACRSSEPAPTRSPSARSHVTAKDCEAWVAHGTGAMMTSISAAIAACPAATREQTRTQMALDPGAIRSSGAALCQSHLGAEYAIADADCFLQATDAPSLQACKFGPMTDAKDTPWAVIAGAIRQTCAPGTAAAASPAGAAR
jgi:hypothetical protein